MNLENEPRGRPESVVNEEHLRAVVEANPQTTVRALAIDLGVSIATVSRHLAAIGKVKKLDKWVPHELTDSQKLRRLEVCSSLMVRNNKEPFLERIITCDEKWILYDNRKRSGQWLNAGEAPRHAPKPPLHPKKVMVTVWWSAKGIIHYSFLQPGQSITAESYCQQIEIMHQKLATEQPILINRQGPILLHDNARPHTSRTTVGKLTELGYEILQHPPYSPDLSPTDYHLFRHLELFLRNKTFRGQEAVIGAFEEFVNSKNVEFYRNGIFSLVSRWEKTIQANGAYFD
jgi:histone-lysine N-methyltransferase SETMAR